MERVGTGPVIGHVEHGVDPGELPQGRHHTLEERDLGQRATLAPTTEPEADRAVGVDPGERR